jgi:hypothetical protein
VGEVHWRDAQIACVYAALDQIERCRDCAQRIVEVVSDAASEIADGVHLLHLPELIFSLLTLLHLLNQLAVGDRVMRRR